MPPEISQKLKDKLISYLKVEDLNQILLERKKSCLKKDEPETTLFSQLYELKKILGAGGFGVVCEVICRKTQRPLALKITQWCQEHPTTAAKALLHEKKMLTERLSHTNIIKAFEGGQEWANYLIMEM